MTDARLVGDATPIAPPIFQQAPHLDVEFQRGLIHARSIANVCAYGKQPIARASPQSDGVPKSLNQRLAENLRAEQDRAQMSDRALASRAGVAPNTIANYKRPAELTGTMGKERSAKLDEIARIASALGIDPAALLVDRDTISVAAYEALAHPPPPSIPNGRTAWGR